MRNLKALLPGYFLLTAVSSYAEIRISYNSLTDERLPANISVRSVSVAGSFNNWNSAADIMGKQEDGIYSILLDLDAGHYNYKLVVNGEIWLEDLSADPALRKDDGMGQGNYNSGLIVAGTKTEIKAKTPDWARDAVWYQIFPERFRNGIQKNDPKIDDINEGGIPGWKIREWGSDWYALDDWERKERGSFFRFVYSRRYGGDIQGIIDKLNYLKDLGINAIYLNPVFRSPSLHKYDGSSFHHIDETFGPDPEGDRKMINEAAETEDPATWVWTSTDKLFLRLVEEVHKRDMRIIIDGVFNHSGRLFFAFQDLLKNGKNSRYASWYKITKWDGSLPDGFDYPGWFGHKSLPEFNRSGKNVDENYKQYVFEITKRWMAPEGDTAKGVDGWRLDVAFCLPHGFWKEWRKEVKKINPEAYITAELVEIEPAYLKGDEFDAAMNYPFAYTVTEFFIDRKNRISPSEFGKRLEELRNAYPEEITAVMQNLMSSHDSARLATLVVNPDNNYRDWGGHFMRSKVESNGNYRVDRGGLEELAVHKLAAAFQMTYTGAPMIYYGDEVRMTGANDPDCRKPMLWEDLTYADEKAHPSKGMSRPAEKNIPDRELLEYYRKLIKIRNENSGLRRGSYMPVKSGNSDDIYAFLRKFDNNEVIVIFSRSAEKIKTDIYAGDGNYEDLLTGEKFNINGGKVSVSLAPRSVKILKKQ